jgi:hypothetical protein
MYPMREAAMTILDPISGQHVTIDASGRPRKEAACRNSIE